MHIITLLKLHMHQNYMCEGAFADMQLCSIPVGVLLHGLERVLLSREKRKEIRRNKYELRRYRELQWWVYMHKTLFGPLL